MVVRPSESTASGADGGSRARVFLIKVPSWSRIASEWCQFDAAGESSFVRPGRPLLWRRLDPGFAAEAEELDRLADLRVIAIVRQRALLGDSQALALSFRASRGFARPVDLSSRPGDTETIPPEVAEAMIDAGLAALNASPEAPW